MDSTSLQRELPLLARVQGPSIVPPEIIRCARTYRQAVRLCWQLRRLKRMTLRQLASEADLPHQHISDYFNADDRRTRRDIPGHAVRQVELVLGNTAIIQWHAMQADLTVLEEIQAGRLAA